MRAIKTHELTPEAVAKMSSTDKDWVYNGLDCCVTAEVLDALLPQLNNQTRATYEFSKSLQAPVLEMRLRGILVDQRRRDQVIREYEADLRIIDAGLRELITEGIGVQMDWNKVPHYTQLQHLFYNVLRLPVIKKRNSKGVYAPTVDRDALEKLDGYLYAQPLVSHILGLRDINKKIGVLKTGIDPDGRMRTSYNIGGTSTGRFSSSLSDFGTGTNLQNIEQRLRSVFIADSGYKFAYIDLEQAESRLVGAIEWNLFHDSRYLDACESSDLHTTVCKLAWPNLPWTGDVRRDREVAETPFYRQHSYRHMSKVLGHGTNYNGKPYTMAKHTKLDARLIEAFQKVYLPAFAHIQWHDWTREELRRYGRLDTLTGRRRWFFGRRDDDATVREAIAYNPQGSVGDILNLGMLKVWRCRKSQLLLQIHDAILLQYPEDREDEILPQLIEIIQVPVKLNHGRQLIIPSEAKVGWNWGEANDNNIDGLVKYKGHDDRNRQDDPSSSFLDRRFHPVE